MMPGRLSIEIVKKRAADRGIDARGSASSVIFGKHVHIVSRMGMDARNVPI